MANQVLRDAAKVQEANGNLDVAKLLTDAANALDGRDADLLAIDAELRKAGFEPWKYKTFAECVAVLVERIK
jgi:hypothetical protein